MKSNIAFSAIFIVLLTLAIASYVAHSEQMGSQRWDLRMIEEAPIWKYLLVNYLYAPADEHWSDRKAALQTILTQFPDSRWADDAARILACGKADFEGDMKGAIAALTEVMEKYPLAHTIVSGWSSGDGCFFDETWIAGRSGLAYLNLDGSIRPGKPFDADGEIPPHKRQFLAYFDHLEKYPRLTKDRAQLFIAQMLRMQGDLAGAIAELEVMVARYADLAVINAADREAAAKPDGYFIGHQFSGEVFPIHRPQYSAYVFLMRLYQSQGEKEKAITTGLTLAAVCSSDGWYSHVNRQVGDLCVENERWAEAEKQYRIALQGVRKLVADRAARKEAAYEVGLISKPPDFVSWEHEILEVEGWKREIAELEELVQEMRSF